MIECAHKDCGYITGWTHKGGNNQLVAPPEGDFYEITAEFTTVSATRFHGVDNEMKLLGCPKCHRIFITKGDTYLDE